MDTHTKLLKNQAKQIDKLLKATAASGIAIHISDDEAAADAEDGKDSDSDVDSDEERRKASELTEGSEEEMDHQTASPQVAEVKKRGRPRTRPLTPPRTEEQRKEMEDDEESQVITNISRPRGRPRKQSGSGERKEAVVPVPVSAIGSAAMQHDLIKLTFSPNKRKENDAGGVGKSSRRRSY